MRLTILYRGPLSSCNYECSYCPFAKQVDSPEDLQRDEAALQRFVDWCITAGRSTSPADHLGAGAGGVSDLRVFFTPWGEALTRRWYWQAFQALSELPFVTKVAVQTNLSCRLDWMKNCNREKLGIWATYHPSQVALDRFVNQINKLVELGVSHSVGMVGVKEDFDSIQELRCRLPSTTYLWINALKRTSDYYSPADVEFLAKIDPLFAINNTRHASMGRECATGHQVVSVAGDGEIRRCHFVPDRLGNLYTDDIGQILRPRVCPNATCGCHIGYAHLQPLKLDEVFGPGLLERIPLSHQSSFSGH